MAVKNDPCSHQKWQVREQEIFRYAHCAHWRAHSKALASKQEEVVRRTGLLQLDACLGLTGQGKFQTVSSLDIDAKGVSALATEEETLTSRWFLFVDVKISAILILSESKTETWDCEIACRTSKIIFLLAGTGQFQIQLHLTALRDLSVRERQSWCLGFQRRHSFSVFGAASWLDRVACCTLSSRAKSQVTFMTDVGYCWSFSALDLTVLIQLCWANLGLNYLNSLSLFFGWRKWLAKYLWLPQVR